MVLFLTYHGIYRQNGKVSPEGAHMVLAGRLDAWCCVGLLPPPYAPCCRYPLRSRLGTPGSVHQARYTRLSTPGSVHQASDTPGLRYSRLSILQASDTPGLVYSRLSILQASVYSRPQYTTVRITPLGSPTAGLKRSYVHAPWCPRLL